MEEELQTREREKRRKWERVGGTLMQEPSTKDRLWSWV